MLMDLIPSSKDTFDKEDLKEKSNNLLLTGDPSH
jgi:hypothetical protein